MVKKFFRTLLTVCGALRQGLVVVSVPIAGIVISGHAIAFDADLPVGSDVRRSLRKLVPEQLRHVGNLLRSDLVRDEDGFGLAYAGYLNADRAKKLVDKYYSAKSEMTSAESRYGEVCETLFVSEMGKISTDAGRYAIEADRATAELETMDSETLRTARVECLEHLRWYSETVSQAIAGDETAYKRVKETRPWTRIQPWVERHLRSVLDDLGFLVTRK